MTYQKLLQDASNKAILTENERKIAIEKLKTAAILQFTLPGVPCIYYGDENGMEGHIDPFCRRCFDWNTTNEKLHSFYKKLGELRATYQNVFKDGTFKEILVEDGFFMYKREKENQAIYIYTNNSSKPQLVTLPENCKDYFTNEILNYNLEIKPYSFGIFIKK